MDKNLDVVADELFGKIRTQFPKISLRDGESNPTEEESQARFFQFDYIVNGKNLGSVTISISDKDGFVVTYSNDIVENQPDGVKRVWFNFLRELREFSKQKMLDFETRDIAKSNLDKRDYNYLSKQYGESKMTESKLWGTNKTSYQDLGETRLIIKHTQPVNHDLPAGRTMHIESIYIENAAGERFRYPHRHLNGARAMAEHIAHGGNPYDEIGQHVVGLSEELSSLRKFKGYVNRTPVVSEAMGTVTERVIERIEEIKKEIHGLQRSSYYESFAESFTKTEEQVIPEDIVNDWIDRLTIRTFNEELKGVFPYIYRLVGEDAAPIKELAIDDLLTNEQVEDYYTPESSVDPELENFESFLNNIVGEGKDIFSNDDGSANSAIEQLNSLVAEEFPVGTDGSNAIESLQDIINDDELNDVFKELADINPESDIRSILKDYIKIKDEENGTDVSSKITFPEADASEEPAEEPAMPASEPAPAMPAPEPAMPPMADPAMAAAAPAAPAPLVADNSDDDNPPFDLDPKSSNKGTDQFGNTIKDKNRAKHAAKKGMRSAIEKAKKAGMKAEDVVTMYGESLTLGTLIERAGMDVDEFFGDGNSSDASDEINEFVQSMFDSETGKFPKGETGVLLSVEKKFGEQAVDQASQIMNELAQTAEGARLKQLAGIGETGAEPETADDGRNINDLLYGIFMGGKRHPSTTTPPVATNRTKPIQQTQPAKPGQQKPMQQPGMKKEHSEDIQAMLRIAGLR
jgi:hypothetical protein